MTILEILKTVIKETGHFELVKDWTNQDYTDNGIYRMMNSANKYLDVNFPMDVYNKTIEFAIEKYVNTLDITPVKFIKGIFIKENNKLLMLSPKLLEYKNNLDISQNGKPAVFIRIDEKTIELFPIPDKNYTLIITGNIYNPDITNPNDETFWSINYPELLIDATKMMIELNLHRNFETKLRYEEHILRQLKVIYNKYCTEEWSGAKETYEKGLLNTK